MEKDNLALATSQFKKQQLGYQIDDIHIISFAANANALPEGDDINLEELLEWEVTFNEKLQVDEELYIVSILINLVYRDKASKKKKRVGALEVEFDFKLKIVPYFIEKGEVPVEIKNNLLSISISTIRGIWYAKVAGTEIDNILVPLFIPTDLREDLENDLAYRASLVEEYTELKNYAKAIEIGRELHQEYPNELRLIDMLGFASIQVKNYTEALEFAEKRLQISPDSTISLANKAFALEQTGQIEEALLTYKTALDLAPNDLQIINRYLSLCLRTDKVDSIKELLDSFEEKPDAYNNYILLNVIAEYKRAINDIEGAMQTIHKAIVLEPTKWEAYITLALAYYSQGNVDEAINQTKIALKLGADSTIFKALPPLKELVDDNPELKSLIHKA